MTIGISRKAVTGFSRRRFLSTAAATGAGALGAIAMPYLSRAADRPQITHGVQSGDIGADGGVVWARADRPSQMMVEVATTESLNNARLLPPIAALPESDFTAKMLLENLPAGQDIFYRIRFRDLSHTDVSSEPVVGRFRTAPADRRDVSFVWGGDVAGQGWGINPDDGGMVTFAAMKQAPAGFPAAFRRHHLCRRHHLLRGETARRQDLEERHDSREGKGRRDARRIPRGAQVQFPRRQRTRLQRRGADLRAMGRPRGHEQLVGLEGNPRRLQGARHLAARRALGPRLPRDVSDARKHRRAWPGLSHAQLRAASRRLHAGRAQLSRPQRSEPADRLRSRQLFHRARSAGLAEARTAELARHLEGDRLRHAAQHHRL